jgi:hypothetical protein
MSPVGGEYIISLFKCLAGSSGYSFLADIGVKMPPYPIFLVKLDSLFFKSSDPGHIFQESDL